MNDTLLRISRLNKADIDWLDKIHRKSKSDRSRTLAEISLKTFDLFCMEYGIERHPDEGIIYGYIPKMIEQFKVWYNPPTYNPPTQSAPSCDPSYPDVCIAPYPPDLDCDEIYYSNFRVIGTDPHGFDKDNDGIGCEVGSPTQSAPSCDPSYPDVCIAPYPPDLNCGDIGYSNFRVIGNDPHGFDGDNDGIGCES